MNGRISELKELWYARSKTFISRIIIIIIIIAVVIMLRPLSTTACRNVHHVLIMYQVIRRGLTPKLEMLCNADSVNVYMVPEQCSFFLKFSGLIEKGK